MSRAKVTPVAESVPFDNDANGFIAEDVQGAIEEARNSAIGALIPLNFQATGNNVANKWLGYNKNTPGTNDVPFIPPQDVDIKGVTLSNTDDNSDTDIEVYVNGVLEFTTQVRNKRTYWDVGGTKGNANQGDRISVYLSKVGSTVNAPSDPLVTLYCKFTSEVAGIGGTNSGV